MSHHLNWLFELAKMLLFPQTIRPVEAGGIGFDKSLEDFLHNCDSLLLELVSKYFWHYQLLLKRLFWI